METVWSSLVNWRSSWKVFQLTPQHHNVYFLLQSKTTHVDSEMINITKFDIVTLCATLSEENNVFENNIYLHFVYTIEVFLKQLVTGHPVFPLCLISCISQDSDLRSSGGHSWWLLSEIIYYKVSQSVWLSVVSIRVRRVSWCEPPVNTPRWADQSPLSSATVNISHLCSAALSCVWSSQSEFLNTIHQWETRDGGDGDDLC